MRAELTKLFTFEAAHELPNHDGQCQRLHGHSYRAEVNVVGPVKAATGEADEGMVVDFAVLKEIWLRDCYPLLEHRFLNDTLSDYLPTTAENIARFIYDTFTVRLAEHFDSEGLPNRGILVASARVWETATGAARFPA